MIVSLLILTNLAILFLYFRAQHKINRNQIVINANIIAAEQLNAQAIQAILEWIRNELHEDIKI